MRELAQGSLAMDMLGFAALRWEVAAWNDLAWNDLAWNDRVVLAASTWGNAPMLGWLVAAVLPVLIHLLSRTRYQRTDWAMMRFLEAAWKRHARRLAIEQWVVLVLRALVLILTALAFADPYWNAARSSAQTGRAPVHWVIVLDATVSMDAAQDGQTRFSIAQQQAADLVDRSREGDSYSFVLLADPPVALIDEPTYDRDSVIAAIRDAARRDTGGDFAGTLDLVHRLIVDARRGGERARREMRVCFLTNLARTTWSTLESPDNARRLGDLSTLATLRVVEIPAVNDASDVAIVAAELRDERALIAGDITLDITLRRLQGNAATRRIQATVNGKRRVDQTVELTGQETRQRIDLEINEPGDYTVEFTINDDSLAANNRWAKLWTLRDRLRILIVEGESRIGERLEMALDPLREQKPIVVTRSPLRELNRQTLADFELVFLLAVPRLDALEAKLMRRYLADGGGLVWTVASSATTADSGRLGESWRAVVPGGSLDFGEVISRQSRLDPDDYAHPILSVFAGQPRSGLLSTRVYRHLALRPTEQASPVLKLDNGDVVMATGTGEPSSGRWAFVGLPCGVVDQDTRWSELTISPAFVPLMQETIAWAMRRPDGRRTITVGEPLRFRTSTGGSAEIVDPLGQHHPVLASAGESYLFDETVFAGTYVFDGDSAKISAQANVDVAETSIERFDATRLPDVLPIGGDWDDSPVLPDAEQGTSLFRWLLAAAALCMCVEMWMTHRRTGEES